MTTYPTAIHYVLRDGTSFSILHLESIVESIALYNTNRPELHIILTNGKHYYLGIAPTMPINGYQPNTDCVQLEISFADGRVHHMDGIIDLEKAYNILSGKLLPRTAFNTEGNV